MTVPVFSINAASEVLERDRRTITKALRHIPADKKERGGQKRWRLRTILDALDKLPGSNNSALRRKNQDPPDDDYGWRERDPREVWRDPRIVASITEFEKLFVEMEAIEDMTKRRKFAVEKLGPLLKIHDTKFIAWSVGSGNGDEASVRCRVAELWLEELAGVRSVCVRTAREAD